MDTTNLTMPATVSDIISVIYVEFYRKAVTSILLPQIVYTSLLGKIFVNMHAVEQLESL